MSKKILFVVRGSFPKGAAYASRAVNFARLFKYLGYSVHVICDYSSERFKGSYEVKEFEDCTYQSVAGTASSLKNLTIGRKSLNVVRKYINDNVVDYVITSAGYDRFEKLLKLCREKSCPLILEICEWYDISSFHFGLYNPFYRKFLKCINGEFQKADAFITISRLLECHLDKYDKPIVKIPTILNASVTTHKVEGRNKKIRIMFAGSPGPSKENFDSILEALTMLGKDKGKFEFCIFGVSKKAFTKKLGEKQKLLQSLEDTVNLLGKIPQDLVHEEYLRSDFSIFIRPNRRSSHAGFPTKLAESMVAGTPVICNDTGDIGLYLINGLNGFLLKDDSPETIKDVFQKILLLDKATVIQMRKEARRMAEDSFDYRLYRSEVSKLFNSNEGTGKNEAY